MIYPNPVSGNATLAFELDHDDQVEVSVYDILGNKLLDLGRKHYLAGQYSIKLDTLSFTSGLYVCMLSGGRFQAPIKFIVE